MGKLFDFNDPGSLELILDSMRVTHAFSEEVADLVRAACALESTPLGRPNWQTFVNEEEPVRRVRTRRGKNKLFIFASVKNDASYPAESENEHNADLLYECDPYTLRFVPQPMTVSYVIDGLSYSHTPDRLVWRREGIYLDEIKGAKEASLPSFRARRRLFEAFCRRHSMTYRVWTDADLRLQPRLRNCETLLQYAGDEIKAAQERAILRRLGLHEPATISELGEGVEGEDGEAVVHALILRGILRIDHNVELSRQSLVWRTGAQP
jgi:hypothetical protein